MTSAPAPSDAQLSELVQTMPKPALAAALGVTERTVNRWISEARKRDPAFGTLNHRAAKIVQAAHAQTDALIAEGRAIGKAAAEELIRIIQYTECHDLRILNDKARWLIEILTSGTAIGLAPKQAEAERLAKGTSHEDLLERVREATASAVSISLDAGPGGRVPSNT